MPGRSRGSISSSSTIMLKLRCGGQLEKSTRASALMSSILPASSLSGTASARTTTRWPGCMRPRSASSSRADTRSVDRSGTSAITWPGHARSPDLKSGGGQHWRQFGMIDTTPSTGDTMSRPPSCRSACCRSKRALSRFSILLANSAFSMSLSAFSFRSFSPSFAFASESFSIFCSRSMRGRNSCGTVSSSARLTS